MNEKLIFYYPVAEFFCSYSLIVYVNMLIDAAGGENTVKECLEVQLSAIDSNFSKVHFSAGFRGIGDMALSRLCMALKNFQEKIKAAKPSRMALT